VMLFSISGAASGPSFILIQECSLIANIMRFTLPQISDESIASPSGFGALHNALLGLSSILLADRSWIKQIMPTTAAEREDAMVLVGDPRGAITLFAQNLSTLTDNVCSNVLSYMQMATRRTSLTHFHPILSPSLKINVAYGRPPTLGHMIVFARDTASLLHTRLAERHRVSESLEHLEQSDFEVFSEFLPPTIDRDPAIARARASRELFVVGNRARQQCLVTLQIVENALLLIWRHLAVWLIDDLPTEVGSSLVSLSDWQQTSHSTRGNQMRALREDANRMFRAVSSKLEGVVLSRGVLQSAEARTHHALLESLLRSIRDVLGFRGLDATME